MGEQSSASLSDSNQRVFDGNNASASQTGTNNAMTKVGVDVNNLNLNTKVASNVNPLNTNSPYPVGSSFMSNPGGSNFDINPNSFGTAMANTTTGTNRFASSGQLGGNMVANPLYTMLQHQNQQTEQFQQQQQLLQQQQQQHQFQQMHQQQFPQIQSRGGQTSGLNQMNSFTGATTSMNNGLSMNMSILPGSNSNNMDMPSLNAVQRSQFNLSQTSMSMPQNIVQNQQKQPQARQSCSFNMSNFASQGQGPTHLQNQNPQQQQVMQYQMLSTTATKSTKSIKSDPTESTTRSISCP